MCIASIIIVIYRLIFIREGLFRLDAQRQFDGVKHDTTHVSQSEHSDWSRHSAATAACVGIRSIIVALLNRDKEMSQSEVEALFLMSTIITE